MHHGDVLSQTYCKAGITSKRQINIFFGRYRIQEFSPYSPVSFLASEKPHFQIPIRSEKTARTKTSLYRADVAFSINLLIYLTLQLQGEKYKNNPILFRYSFFPTVSVGRHAIFFSKRLNEKDCLTRQGNVQKMLIPTGLLPKVATVNEVKTQSHAS